VYGDIGTLESLLEMEDELPYREIKLEVDQFKGRLSNIVLNGYLTSEHRILDEIEKAESKKTMETALKKLKEKLYEIMSHNAKLYLTKRGIMRPHSQKTRRANSKALKTTLKKANFGLYY
jgi:2C-methyl-D-erythritol 2,4-cyclodiphosphate synthase